ncbi:MAG: glycosyltransferase N-terminal domain-containing protein [Ferruginibacter sp.]
MSIIFYNLFLLLYSAGIRIVSPWNEKARRWIKGRLEFPTACFEEKTIWMHCASLGEFEQGRPLLEEIKKRYPSYKVLLSFFSPSGYEVMKNYPGADLVFYLPMDNMSNAKKLIGNLNPALVLWVKYEYWYYYLTELKQRNIPVLLVSGIFRKSQPFFKWYGSIWKKMLSRFDWFFLQDEESIALLASIGIKDNTMIAGDTRFDRVIAIAEKKEPVDHIKTFIANDRVLVAGSTWEEDEIELLHFVKANPAIKFIIAPHEIHESNLADVKKEFKNPLLYSELSIKNNLPEDMHVLIIDNIGMLSRLYQYADVAYVGGGFGSEGVHNVLEAAVYGKPVVFGPVYEKFSEAKGLVECGGGITVSGPLQLEAVLGNLFHDREALTKSSVAAKDFVYNNKGATGKIFEHIQRNRLLIN